MFSLVSINLVIWFNQVLSVFDFFQNGITNSVSSASASSNSNRFQNYLFLPLLLFPSSDILFCIHTAKSAFIQPTHSQTPSLSLIIHIISYVTDRYELVFTISDFLNNNLSLPSDASKRFKLHFVCTNIFVLFYANSGFIKFGSFSDCPVICLSKIEKNNIKMPWLEFLSSSEYF